MFGFTKSETARALDALYGEPAQQARELEPTPTASSGGVSPWQWAVDDGSKFPGGFGPTKILWTDYWALRQRSSVLFEQNLYARGLIRRLVTNEINVGLHLEATPEEKILGLPEDGLSDWSEDVENRFHLWESDPELCDQNECMTFGALQATIRREALVSGDVLVVLRQDPRTKLPRIQIIGGECVQTPLEFALGGKTRTGNEIVHGVERDSSGRHLAFWIEQANGTSKRLPAYGEKSGRRIAWLVYGTDKRLKDVRGKPMLALVMQSMLEIDRYRDATQRKAVINSMLAMFVTKTQDKPGSRPLTAGAIRRGTDPATDSNGVARRFRAAEHIPGLVLEELQHGEEPKAFQTSGTTEAYGVFEEAIVQAMAWANEIPPEIMTLAFSNNYSASQAAINEFKIYLNRVRTDFGRELCQPLYVEWLVAQVLAKKIPASGLLEAWRDYSQHDTFGAWVLADWSGNVKPAVDQSKLVDGYDKQVAGGYMTRDRAARELNGSKYSKNVKKLRLENEALAEANKPMAELEASKKPQPPAAPVTEPVAPDDPNNDGNDDGAAADENAEGLPN